MPIATYVLLGSCIGIVVLIVFKAFENHSGTMLFGRFRTRLGEGLDARLARLRAGFPRAAARVTRLTTRIVRAYASFGLAKMLLSIETFLENSLRHLRRAPRTLERKGEASPFLREVAAYKRMLEREDETVKEGEVIEGEK